MADRRAYMREYYLKNKEEIKEYRKMRYGEILKENPDYFKNKYKDKKMLGLMLQQCLSNR